MLGASLTRPPRCALPAGARAVRLHVGVGEVVALRADTGPPEFPCRCAYRHGPAAQGSVCLTGQASARQSPIGPPLGPSVFGRVWMILWACLLRGLTTAHGMGFRGVLPRGKRSHVLGVATRLIVACVVKVLPLRDWSNEDGVGQAVDVPGFAVDSGHAVALRVPCTVPLPAAGYRVDSDLRPEADGEPVVKWGCHTPHPTRGVW